MPRKRAETNHVSLILVSHSHKIAYGVAELAQQVAGSSVPIFPVGGTKDGGLGTDCERLVELLRCTARRPADVIIADLGSSVLAARAAVAELGPTQRGSVILADAPFVEGAIAAAVAASTGASLAEVVRAAEQTRNVSKL
jgi:dihydroxyacetone kinase phosphotransfer subunit